MSITFTLVCRSLTSLLAVAALLLGGSPAFAQENTEALSDLTVQMASREILVGESQPSITLENPDDDNSPAQTISVLYVKLLRELVRGDPLIDAGSLKISVAFNRPAETIAATLERRISLSDPDFQIPGFNAYRNAGSNFVHFAYVPHQEADREWAISCAFLSSKWSSWCTVGIAYPADSRVAVSVGVYAPEFEPMANSAPLFADIAKRLLEFAECIDVTDRSDAERAALERALIEGNAVDVLCEHFPYQG